ncbi:RecQ family ATP-dependent DNA helicase [Vibrio coralliirubri]|uniref:RecQ family ATP-dependent DNA helicase n=1 Tax=Vibrio coralliirubri TaxID=1516159 RepID=UPI0022849B46|nr:RecQ family ATP-dependent DNA helicase [Vibrio coralliirubri]MCY9861119.1 RecQ family ATP-dependent DNA helicase [Vibrio coralliirubri]
MINNTLEKVFGFKKLRKGQQDVINAIMEGRSALAVFPTGAGKSLCYQLPALHLPHLTLVISPLIALMQDQLEFLESKGIPAATIDSTKSADEVREIMTDIREGKTKVLMVSVERLKNDRFKSFIATIPTSLLVVDEAHCISEWGHNFRPDYLKIPDIQKELNIPQVLLLTATATPNVVKDIQEKFDISTSDAITTGFHRENLKISVIPCNDEDKLNTLTNILTIANKQPTIVYVTLQKTSEHIAEELVRAGVNAMPFHAAMDIDLKTKTQLAFMNGDVDCIVATIAFGMGIDKSNIRNVIHFDLPSSIEGYAQEIGRAGRDGEPSRCILLGSKSGKTILENFIYGATPELSSIEHVVNNIYANKDSWTPQVRSLSSAANMPLLTLKTLLVYLELKGVIEFKYSFAAEYRFKFIKSQAEIVRNSGRNKTVIDAIFNATKHARVWSKVDFSKIRVDRKVATAVLMSLHESGDLFVECSQIMDSYSVLNRDEAPNVLSKKLHESFVSKEASDVARITNMVGFFESNKCLANNLATYFGDVNAPLSCGNCSVCCGEPATLPTIELPEICKDSLSDSVNELSSMSKKSLTNLQLAKMLCGIHSPLVTSIKARKTEAFGKFQEYSFPDVLEQLELNSSYIINTNL